MFGGFAPPQQSEQEIKELEMVANFNVQTTLATAVILYLSPFAVDVVSKMF